MKNIIHLLIMGFLLNGGHLFAQDTVSGIIWHPIIQLSDTNQSDYLPRIALSGDDTIHVTWTPDYILRLPYARSTDGGNSFEPARDLLTDTIQFPYGAFRPFVLANSSQVFVLFTNSEWPLYLLKSTDGGTTFHPVQQTNSESSISIDWATIEGDTLAVLYPRNGLRVVHRSTDNGATWSTSPANLGYLDRIVLAGGRLHHVYHADYGIAEIEYNRSTDLGESWGDAIPISELDGEWGEIPSITGYTSECGTEILSSWRDTKYGTYGLGGGSIIIRYSPDGGNTWLPESLMTSVPHGIGSTLSINGRVRAVGWDAEVVSNTIFRPMLRATNNSLWNFCPPYDVTSGAINSGDHMMIASSKAIHVVWSQQFGQHFKILYRRGEFLQKNVSLALSTDSLTIDTTAVLDTTIDTIFVTNAGSDPLVIGTAIASDESFSLPSIPDTIPGSSTVPVEVYSHPQRGGLHTAKITLYHDAESSPDCFTVTGIARWNAAQISYTPNTWQLVSIPLESGYRQKLPLLYSYDGSYHLEDSIIFGKGYWAKPGDSLVTYEGIRRDSVTIPIRKGWNLVGSLDVPVGVSDVTTEPDGILGAFYEFTGDGYAQADSIRPGRAYWVKATAEGVLELRNPQ